jgi:hypothetical protein
VTYDLFAFDRKLLEGPHSPQQIYELAMEGLLQVEASADVDLFVDDVFGHFPVLDGRRTADFRALLKPQFEFERGPGWVWFGLPERSDLRWLVSRLATRRDLGLFDPQTGELELPPEAHFDLPGWSPGDGP